MLATYVILPGIGGSGEQHWQTLWERANPRFQRFMPSSWDQPVLAGWIVALDRTIGNVGGPVVLVAHSLACVLVAHWSARGLTSGVAGAFLVAVPDPEGPSFPASAASFKAVPSTALPFPSLILASSNDPYGSTDHAHQRSRQWNSGLVEVGHLGHINASSGLGSWEQGRALLTACSAGLRLTH
jgi:predicted alpha/beta hydrolase family esterase